MPATVMQTAQSTREQVTQHVTRLALQVNVPLVHYLVVGRGACHDLDTLLVLLVIIQRANRHPGFGRLDPADLTAGRLDELPTLRVNMQSIADSTGIPRESVRRKVAELVQCGWVARDGANLRFTVDGYLAIAPLREAAVDMTCAISDAVNRIMQPPPPGSPG